MAWNEPGRGGKDPWGGKNDQKDPKKSTPDLDALLRTFRKRLGGFGKGNKPGWQTIIVSLAVLLAVWLASGFYQVDSAEQGLVLQFGAYRGSVTSGLHWHLPYPLGSVIKVNVDQVSNVGSRSLRLTRDEKLVNVDVTAHYQVNNARNYAFSVRNADGTLRDVLQSVIGYVVGQHALSDLLAPDHGGISQDIQAQVQKRMDAYGAGLRLSSVSIQSISPPNPLKDAFADAEKAKHDMARMKSKAQAYADRVVPGARGETVQRLDQARADKIRAINQAKGETARFLALLGAYRQAPQITRMRLYLDTMGEVLTHSSKVVTRAGKQGPTLSLPLSGLTRNEQKPGTAKTSSLPPQASAAGQAKSAPSASGDNAGHQVRKRERRQR